MQLPDFSTAYGDLIGDGGEMRIPLTIQSPPEQTWHPDEDGLLMSGSVIDMNGDACLLSVLFPMPYGAACAKVRQRRFPVKPGDMLTILREVDRVTGRSGEEYSRFLADVIPMNGPATRVYEV